MSVVLWSEIHGHFRWSCDHPPEALDTDALAMAWDGLHGYAFPPISLIPLVLGKVRNAENCRIILIAPLWQRRSWFSQIVDLLVEIPLLLPVREDLLYQPQSQVFPSGSRTSLSLCLEDQQSALREREDFRKRLPSLLQGTFASQQKESIAPELEFSLTGVQSKILIHPLPL